MVTGTFCDLFTSDRKLCLDVRYLRVETNGYCADEFLSTLMDEDGTITMNYDDFSKLEEGSIRSLVQIVKSTRTSGSDLQAAKGSNTLFYYDVAVILAILRHVDESRRECLLWRFIDTGVDPYYEITDKELARMIEYGELDAYMYTVRQVLHNPHIDLSRIGLELRVYKDFVAALREACNGQAKFALPDENTWTRVANDFVTERFAWKTRVAYGKKSYSIDMKDLNMYGLIVRARNCVVCDKGQYTCPDDGECDPCKIKPNTACKTSKCRVYRITVCSRCRRERCNCK